MTTTTFYSAGGDGSFYYSFNGGTWAAAYGSDGSANVSNSTVATVLDYGTHLNSGHYQIGRMFLPFDTSTLGSGATISAATITLTSDYYSNADSETAYLVSIAFTSITANTQFARANWGTGTDYGNRAITAWNPLGTSAEITLTADGINNISKTGTTYFGGMFGFDRAGATAPTGINNISPRSSDYAGTSSDPLLTVTYTEAPPATAGFLYNMI
jgi:hypothetical protein